MTSLSLQVDPNARYFTNLVFREIIDVAKLHKVLLTTSVLKTREECVELNGNPSHWTYSFASQRQQLEKLRAEVSGGSLIVRYKFAHGGKYVYGRVYPEHHLSFGEIAGDQRAYVLGDDWTALDFANCHPNIMYQALEMSGRASDFSKLGEYCSNRDGLLKEVMATYGVDRGAAKNLFIRLLYLGTFKAWAKDNRLGDVKATAFIDHFSREMECAADIIVRENKAMHGTIEPNERAKEKQDKRGPGRPPKKAKLEQASGEADEPVKASRDQVVSMFCQEHERRLLRHFFDFCVERGLITVEPGKPVDCMLRYDGIDVLKTDWARAVPDPQAFFVDAQKYIAEKSGFQMTITEKPYAPSPLAAQIEAEADLDNRIPEDAREELMPSTLIALREYDAQKAYFERFIVKIINQGNFAWKQINHVDGMVDATQRNKNELRNAFEHVKTKFISDSGEVEEDIFIERWLRDECMRTSNSVDFIPYCDPAQGELLNSESLFNLFSGYPEPHNTTLDLPLSCYLEQFHYIGLQLCENDPVKYQCLWLYLAQMVQFPSDRPDISFCFQDKVSGAGADLYFDTISEVIGRKYYTNSSNFADMFGPHAEGTVNKLLVVFNESEFSSTKEHQARIKEAVTAPRINVNAKHIRPYTVRAYNRIFFFSNKQNSLALDNSNGERRMIIFRATDHCKVKDNGKDGFTAEDFEYLAKRYFITPQFRKALLTALKTVDLGNYQVKAWRNLTLGHAYFDAMEKCATYITKFFIHYLRSLASKHEITSRNIFVHKREWEPENMQHLDNVIDVLKSEVHEAYRDFLSEGKGCTSGVNPGLCNEIFSFWRVHSQEMRVSPTSLIREVKNSNEYYRFNPRKLWHDLMERRFVAQEGYVFHQASVKDDIARVLEHEVNPLFKSLASANVCTIGAKRPIHLPTAVINKCSAYDTATS